MNSFSRKAKRAALCAVLMLVAAAGTVAISRHHDLWPHVQWRQERLHSALEALGSIAAVSMALVLVSRRRNQTSRFWLATGFLGMGLLDFFHAACADPEGLALLQVSSCLLCASGYVLCRFPPPPHRHRRGLFRLVAVACLAAGAWVLVATEWLPSAGFMPGHRVEPVFRFMSVLAATMFLVGGIKFVTEFVRTGDMESFLFLCLAMLFALADFTFSRSELWFEEWWSWHITRLIAFLLAFGFVIHRYLVNRAELRIALIGQRRVERVLKRRSHELAERVTELNCLHRLQKLTERPDYDLEDIFLGLIDILPSSFVGSDAACVRIVYENEEFKSPGYRETQWSLARPIHCCQEPIGHIEVSYAEKIRTPRSGLFREEERRLLRSVCDHLSETIQRKRLEKEIAQVSIWEHQRFGQELHDDLCQDLTGLGYLADCLQGDLQSQDAPDAKRAEVLAKGLQSAKNKVRVIAKGQALSELDAKEFVPSVRNVADLAQERWGIPCDVHSSCNVRIEKEETANQLLRITQEAIYNAEKHSQARQIDVYVESVDRRLTVRICDDGTGVPERLPTGKGMGLHIMRHRAHAICAALLIQHAKPCGTVVECTLRLLCDQVDLDSQKAAAVKTRCSCCRGERSCP